MIETVVKNFKIEGNYISGEPYGSGHINDTRLVVTDKKKYIFQKINKNVFKDPASLMDNFQKVTAYLADIIVKEGGDPMRETLNVIKANDGKNYYLDSNGDYWRALVFVEDSMSFDKVERPEHFFNAARFASQFLYSQTCNRRCNIIANKGSSN